MEKEKSSLWVDVNIELDNSTESEDFSSVSSEDLRSLCKKLKTGDMILCHGYNPKGFDPGLDGLIEFAHSPWNMQLW